MRGPTYILKKTHLENDEKREYKMHVQKLQNIQSQKLKGEVKRSISVDKRLLEDKQKKVVQNRLFKEEEQRREQKLENKALIAKLEQIQKGKYSIMKNIKDQTFRESVYYLSSNQNLKTGNNFNPSNSKTRLRTMTANTESSRNIGSQNTYYKNSEFNEDQNEKYPKTANFFGGNFNNFNNNTDNTHKNSSRSQSNLGDHKHGYNAASNQNQIPNQHQFSGANSNYGGTIYSQSSNNNPNSTNGFNKNKENDPQTFNKYHLQRALKTEGNAEYPENQNIYSKNDQNNSNLHRGQSNPNYYKDQNNPNLYRDLNHPNALKDQNIDERDQNNPNLYKDVNNHNLSKQQSNPHYQGDPNNPEPLRDYNNPKYYNDQSDPNFFKNNPNLLRGNDYYNINDDQMIGDDGYRNGNLDNPDRIKQLSRDGKRRRINSSINLAQLNKHVSASIERQKEQERIAFENNKIVQRMMKLPPVVPTKTNLKKEFSKQKKLMKQISKFHEFKERKVPAFGKSKKKEEINMLGLLDGVPLDENNQELMDQRIHLVINVKEIAFVNFLPVSSETEKYFMEIQASIHEIRRTNPEIYSDFSKSVINEFFYLREIKQNRIIYIGLYKWTPLDNGEHFLGDFELDLTPYYLQSGVHQIHYDLRNFKQMHKLPNYMVKDMRKKGWIDIEISVKSSVKQYLMDLDIIKKDYGSQEASIAYDNQTNPTERKKNSEESLVQLINSNQNGQTEKQQKLQQLKYQMNPKQKGISSFNSQNTSFNQGNKVNGVQQKQISNQSYNSFNTINNTQQNNSKGSKRGSNSNQHKSKINLQEEYDQDNFEKEDSNSQNNNNSYLQQFSDNEDEKNKKSHTGKQNFVLKEEEIEV
ncbi:hypothetical protein TTHERM_00133660 (macronuclear) [Tetrahymena thermophila SB210]|uniref:Uncharacterized protein n=1 Tax=Tetrahymena thermophila (strain SB210) TaxID=312017 RepID=I7MKJ7_TETTS|nr:hypothetical protein TTHERM_00133660 [Tetrahymena thermophila SB210]EAR99400.2 hypothetical protein TTHERM_00133660 [Tetrahymena thermophila SB210]|eukprot:XP_001019645.2 hypothetical protein TTHERM_00133660 [Tetrahymena thermophila SB210]